MQCGVLVNRSLSGCQECLSWGRSRETISVHIDVRSSEDGDMVSTHFVVQL